MTKETSMRSTSAQRPAPTRSLRWLAALLACMLALSFTAAQPPVKAAAPAERAGPPAPARPPLAHKVTADAPTLTNAAASSSIIPLEGAWAARKSEETYSTAWGDVDNDGDLDLAVGNYLTPNLLYRNCTYRQLDDGCLPDDLYLSSTPAWTSPFTNTTESVAWGDVDNDGDLDLAVGNQNEASQLYRNNRGKLEITSWTPTEYNGISPQTYSVAWGDVDSDGDLDLATGQVDRSNKLYRNCHATQPGDGCDGATDLSSKAFWTASITTTTESLAWGDVDGDGWIDLAVGNSCATHNCASNRLYRNISGTLVLDSAWNPAPADTTSLAWGDVNGDNKLDLAVGNFNAPSQLYLNTNGTLHAALPLSSKNSGTRGIAWGDANRDDRPDLVLGNFGSNQLYLSNGISLTLDTSWQPVASFTQSIAWADADNDGQLDLAVGNGCESQSSGNCYPTQLYRNTTSVLSNVPQNTLSET
jgi:hypothetical protein